MNLSGTFRFNQPVKTMWEALHNPEVLRRVIPGCEELTRKPDGSYDVLLRLGIAAVKGEYRGRVQLEDVEEPTEYQLHAEGSGTPGFVKIQMRCKLQEVEQGTKLDWECQADVGGPIASVGNRVLSGIAKFMAGKFFKDLAQEVQAVAK